MYVYNHHWKARRSMLLYPRTHGQADVAGKFRLPFNDGEHECLLGFVDVMKNGKLNAEIGEEVLGKLRG